MPRIVDLTDDENELHGLAPYRLQAVMVHPEDKRARQTLLEFAERPIAGTSANPSKVDDLTRDRPLLDDSDRLRLAFSEATTSGLISGGVLIALIWFAERGQKPVLSKAVEHLTDVLSGIRRQTPHDFEYGPGGLALRGHRNKSAVLKDWRRFRNVAHLWAAHTDLHGWYGAPALIKDFLRAAEQLAFRARRARIIGRSNDSLIKLRRTWRCELPENFRAAD